jgi:hypothetical protein
VVTIGRLFRSAAGEIQNRHLCSVHQTLGKPHVLPSRCSVGTLGDNDACPPSLAPMTARSTTHAAYAATAASRVASQRWPHVTHSQSAPASIALCVRDVGVWHIGHVRNNGVSN